MSHGSNIADHAARQAAAEGMLDWDPAMWFLAACEAKASWYEPEAARWKRTHSGDEAGIRGQLAVLREAGFDTFALLHLAATAPRQLAGTTNPWFQAGSDAARGRDTFPALRSSALPHGAAYLRAIIGAVAGSTEEFAGAGGTIEVVEPARRNSDDAITASGAWRRQLHQRLSAMGKPSWPGPVFVLECPTCRKWRMGGRPSGAACCEQ